VLDVIRSSGGATDEEGLFASGFNVNTYRPRRVELVGLGLVRDSGERRLTQSRRRAIVWVAA
jgi:hypothetical protein